jgi:hypothetical protein
LDQDVINMAHADFETAKAEYISAVRNSAKKRRRGVHDVGSPRAIFSIANGGNSSDDDRLFDRAYKQLKLQI